MLQFCILEYLDEVFMDWTHENWHYAYIYLLLMKDPVIAGKFYTGTQNTG